MRNESGWEWGTRWAVIKVIQIVLMHKVHTCCASVSYTEDFYSEYRWQEWLHSGVSANSLERGRSSISMFWVDPACLALNFFLTFVTLLSLISFFLKDVFLYKMIRSFHHYYMNIFLWQRSSLLGQHHWGWIHKKKIHFIREILRVFKNVLKFRVQKLLWSSWVHKSRLWCYLIIWRFLSKTRWSTKTSSKAVFFALPADYGQNH